MSETLKWLTPDHEVLTATRGWVAISKVVMTDEVACLESQSRELSYQHPNEVIERKFSNEDAYAVRAPAAEYYAASNLRAHRQPRLSKKCATPMPAMIESGSSNTRFSVPEFVCGADNNDDVRLPMDIWISIYCAFVVSGRFVCRPPDRNSPAIWRQHQTQGAPIDDADTENKFMLFERMNPEEVSLITLALDHAGVKNKRTRGGISIESVPIGAELARHYGRQHPFAWGLNEPQALILLRNLTRNRPRSGYCPLLAGDLQRLALHAGVSAICFPDGSPLGWAVAIRSDPAILPGYETVIAYTGDACRLTVPTGIFYVRRNGVPIWAFDDCKN